MAVAITRAEPDAVGLRHAAARTKDADAARRMLALALVLDGRSRADAARSCGMTGRPCATGCIASMSTGWRACLTARRLARSRG